MYTLYDVIFFIIGEEGQEYLKGYIWNSAWTNSHSETKYRQITDPKNEGFEENSLREGGAKETKI